MEGGQERVAEWGQKLLLLSPNLECDLTSLHCSACCKYHILNNKYNYNCTRLQQYFYFTYLKLENLKSICK